MAWDPGELDMHREANAREDGFSLLELVLVSAIVVTLAGIAVPRYGSAAGRYRLDLVARRIAADLAYAQAVARQTSRLQSVLFEINDERYTLDDLEDIDRREQEYVVTLSDSRYYVDLASAVFQNANGYTSTSRIWFNMWGRPQCGNPSVGVPLAEIVSGVVVVKVGGRSRTITIAPVTGKVSIQ